MQRLIGLRPIRRAILAQPGLPCHPNEEPMPNLTVTEIKAFVPARDFSLSRQFYQDSGFTLASDGDGVAYFHFGGELPAAIITTRHWPSTS